LRSSRRFAQCILLVTGLAGSRAPNALAQDSSPGSDATNAKQNSKSAGTVETAAKSAVGQEEHDPSENALGLRTIKNIMRDQREIWTSPAHVRLGHLDWLVPFAGLTAGFLVTDRDASLHLSNSPSRLKNFSDLSNYGIAGMAGAVGGLYLWGKATSDAHKQEAGVLSGEAAVNALLVSETLKYTTGRERPGVAFSRGKFWQGASGGTINDGSIRMDFSVRRDWAASAFVQYEQWKFPVLAPTLQKNITATVQFTFWPQREPH
jgi:hypothetical protein